MEDRVAAARSGAGSRREGTGSAGVQLLEKAVVCSGEKKLVDL